MYAPRTVKIYTNDREESHTYDFLQTKAGQRKLEEAKNYEYKICCTCTGDDLPLHIARFNDKYIIRTNPATKHLHKTDCPRYSEENINGINIDKPSKENENGSISIVENKDGTKRLVFGFNDNKPASLSSNGEENNKKHTGNSSKANAHTKLYTLTQSLLHVAWDNHIMERGIVPFEGNVFYQIFNNLIKTSENMNGDKLSEFIYVPAYNSKEYGGKDITPHLTKAIRSIWLKENKHNLTYIIGKLIDYTEFEPGIIKLKLLDPFKKGYFYITVGKSYFNRKYSEKNKVQTAEYYIAALVKYDVNIVASRLEALPVIPNRGITVDSSKEIEFANMLIGNRVLFTKPTLATQTIDLDGYIPDFFILDKNDKSIKKIAEVFGFYTEEYKIDMNNKIDYYSKLKKYDFIYWKANENEPMPVVR